MHNIMYTGKPLQTLRILVVEDHAPDRLLIVNTIQQLDVPTEVIVAESVSEGLSICADNEFDCIFLDYYFPELTGMDFIKAYTQKRGKGNIIIVTGQDDVNMAVECMKMGACDYLLKNQITKASISKSLNYVTKLMRAQEFALQTEQALLESEMRLKSIIGKSPIILFNIDHSGTITLFRGKATSHLSIKPEKVIGQKIENIWQQLPVKYEDYLKACKEEELQFKTMVNDHYFDVNFIPVKNEHKQLTGMMGVAIDVTSFKKSEEELRSTIEFTEAGAKIKEQFLANMSHEIRTPIHGIISLTQFVLKTELNGEQTNYLNLIKKSADTLLVIVNDILDLSKIDSGKMTFEEVPFNLRDTIQTAVAAFIPKTIEKNIQIKTSVSPNLPEYIAGDPVRLTQILNNLLGNAVKFTEKGFIAIGASATESNGDSVVIEFTIKDTGIGIPQHKIGTIFESFTQAGSDITRKYGGTGLGLNISKQLVEKQNGTINVESVIDEGTTFIVKMPFMISKESTITEESSSTVINENNRDLSILVAEDHDINRFIIEKMLKEWGFKTAFATTGTEAVQKASEATYDLILMDVEMPDMNGYRATEVIRTEFTSSMKNVPIVAMTGNAMTGERERCLEAGMNDYISKPFKPEELKQLILKLTVKESITASENTNSVEVKKEDEMETAITTRQTDLTFLKEISDNNEQFFREFITMFLNNTPKSIQDMKTSLMSTDWEALRQAAHKVKPSFNYVGLKELNALSAKIEEFAKQQCNMEEIKTMLNRIEAIAAVAFKELEEEINTITHQ
ncbi:MAG TPA: response regulator [Bacteroidia bacterium]|nr:response regulator [Bacteroidia bacterium]